MVSPTDNIFKQYSEMNVELSLLKECCGRPNCFERDLTTTVNNSIKVLLTLYSLISLLLAFWVLLSKRKVLNLGYWDIFID